MQLLSLSLLSLVVVFAQSTSTVTAPPAAGGQVLYYISNGQSLTEVRSDPEHVQADQWAAFYFKKGTKSSVISQRWGLEIQASPAGLMKSIVASQKFERTYEKWCGCEWGSNTFFNVIAPVAMTKSPSALSAGKAEVIMKAHAIGDRIGQIVKTVNDAYDTAAEKELPMRTTGPFAEYVENIHKALDQYGAINNLISLLSDNGVATIEKRLNQLASEVSNIEKASPAVNQPISAAGPSRTFSDAVSYPIVSATINGAKSVSNVVQAVSDGGNEISVENHFDNGQWERYRVLISDVTSSTPIAIEASAGVWSVQLECKSRAQCVRWEGGESPGFEGSDQERNSRGIGVVFKTEAEALSFADRVSPSRLNAPPPAADAHVQAVAKIQPSNSTKAKEDDARKGYTIQVGVFTSESKAQTLMSQLKERHYDAVFIDAIPNATGPYHVRVGRLPDIQAAKDLRKKLQGDGFDTYLTTLSQ